jgi:glycerol-3-phosphate dehydrogenase (NAD(P)+)
MNIQNGSEDALHIGIGDLYVTVYGGRTRKIGILLGEGETYEEAMNILAGVTLESLVVARRVANAIYRKAELGQVSLADFPMLCHSKDVLDNGKDAELPWESFTYDHTK